MTFLIISQIGLTEIMVSFAIELRKYLPKNVEIIIFEPLITRNEYEGCNVVNDFEQFIEKSDLIKTEGFNENLKLYVTEGKEWMRKKYGFNSHWSLKMYSKFFYDKFFEFNPELIDYKI